MLRSRPAVRPSLRLIVRNFAEPLPKRASAYAYHYNRGLASQLENWSSLPIIITNIGLSCRMASSSAAAALPHRSAPGINIRGGVTVNIEKIWEAQGVLDEILSRGSLQEITGIRIDGYEPEADDEDADIVESSPDADKATPPKATGSNDSSDAPTKPQPTTTEDRMVKLIEPIITLLTAISDSGGSLRDFRWEQSSWYASKGVRPASFWDALWKHSRTLETLSLGFYTHELHKVKPGHVAFPALRELYIDASTAHGDDGSAVESIFKNSPNLEILQFDYPNCDLYTCRIQNISWDYTFPHMHTLAVSGYDSDPAAYTAFLSRSPLLRVLQDGVSAYGDDEDEKVKLSDDAMPALKALYLSDDYPTACRTLEAYLSTPAKRAIEHLYVGHRVFNKCDNIANIADSLKYLELEGVIIDWRPEEDSSDEDSSSDDDDDPRVNHELEAQMKAERARKRALTAEDGLCDATRALKQILPKLHRLQELSIEMDSERVSVNRQNPPAMDKNDLATMLSLLPPNTHLRALRLWDSRAEPLPQDLLDDFPAVPATLEYLSWGTQYEFDNAKLLYRLERRDGKVKAVPCEPLRKMDANVKIDWIERRILDS
ncbi:hypothetical protein EJ04DRAFT_252408 [Polyplosphaeria fusca]|uniref:Uncharacterized protein n=1 Tax=Polyplosphaeria fusca TaxID=682080 RepID=A0A9P4V115_9PLEO|nr:hypothetical protein EJ04DRAFT_252408 [Polyplosphaeria fusca]